MSRLKRLIVEIHRRSLWQVVTVYLGARSTARSNKIEQKGVAGMKVNRLTILVVIPLTTIAGVLLVGCEKPEQKFEAAIPKEAGKALAGAWDYTMEWEPFVSDATFTCRGSGIWELVDVAGSITGEGGGRGRCTAAEYPTRRFDHREMFRVVRGHVDGTDLSFAMDQLRPDGTPQDTYCYRWGNCTCQFQGTFSDSVAEGRFSCAARVGESRGTWSARKRR